MESGPGGKQEREYWENVFARHYGISRESAEKLLAAQENAAQCAPKLLGSVGITEGNRQTLSLGMSMSQFTNVTRFRPNRELWESVARKGEQPDDYMKKEVNREPHLGETPYDCVEEVSAHAKKALALCEAVIKAEGEDREELNRLYTDAQAVYSMTHFLLQKDRGSYGDPAV